MDTDLMLVDLIDAAGRRRVLRHIHHFAVPIEVSSKFGMGPMAPIPQLNEGEEVRWLPGREVPLVIVRYRKAYGSQNGG